MSKTCFVALLFLFLGGIADAQTLTSVIVDSSSGEPIIGANVLVKGTAIGGSTGTDGRVAVSGIPDGRQTVIFSAVGYDRKMVLLHFPLPPRSPRLLVKLRQSDLHMEGVTVTTARTSYHLNDAPVRIEVKGEDDIQETMIDHPSSISELFLESTGIQVLQTSAVSGYVSVKLQGLDGSFTQILKDGFPLYGGLSSGLSMTQIPPLDLKRVEIIKGPSSSLYGGGAIAGLINLISKKPDPKGKTTILLNGESSRGIDAGLYYSKEYNDRLGVTLLVNGNSHSAYDADNSGFSDVPGKNMYTISPNIFYSPDDNTTVRFGVTTSYENLLGGDMSAISSGSSAQHPYLEKSKSDRTYTQLEMDSKFGDVALTLKNSFGYFSLDNSLEAMTFTGSQRTSYTELTLQSRLGDNTVTGGLNLTTDGFRDERASLGMDRSYNRWTAGAFAQDDWQITAPLTVEAGLRLDKPSGYSLQVLPRIGMIYRVSGAVGLRASAGMGYKTPTIFSEQSDPYAIYSILPVGSGVAPEKSVGGEFDITYNGIAFGDVSLNIDQAFFYTRVNDPFLLTAESWLGRPFPGQPFYSLLNGDGFLFSRGIETDVNATWGDVQAYMGYTYTDSREAFANASGGLFLTPRNRFITDIAYEMGGYGEVGVELRYTGSQLLHDGTSSPAYWIMDLLLEKSIGRFTLFLAAENFFNFKQADYSPIYSGPVTNPQFNDIWAPLEGRVINGGMKIQF